MDSLSIRGYLKNFLVVGNTLVSILGIVAFSIGIWVVVDKPKFLNILNDASADCTGDNCADMTAGLGMYMTGAGIIIAMAFLIVCVAVLGCCGAHKQSRVMLTSFSVILLIQFIIMLAGAIVASKGGVTAEIENNLYKALALYDEKANMDSDPTGYAVKEGWNQFQKDFQCCGVVDVTDWSNATLSNATSFNFPAGVTKPEGCCHEKKDGTPLPTGSTDQTTCLKAPADADSEDYFFGGCFTGMMDRLDSHKGSVVTIGVLTLVFMFINIVASFALCMMLTGDV